MGLQFAFVCSVYTIIAIAQPISNTTTYPTTTPTLSPTSAPTNAPTHITSLAYCAGVNRNGIDILETVQMVVSLVGITVSVCITYHSCKNIPKMKTLSLQIKYLFYSSLACTYIANIAALIQSAICLFSDIYENILSSISILAFVALILIVLAILLKRLYSSFKNSAYSLSTTHISSLLFVYLVIVLLALFAVAEWIVITMKYDGNFNQHEQELRYITGIFEACMILSYIITSVYCIVIFTIKLLQLTKSQMSSVADVNSLHLKNTQLSNIQRKLIQKTSKYIGLLTIAIISTCLTATGWLLSNALWDKDDNYGTMNSYLTELMLLITTFDSIVNVICLWLQFPFADRYYNRLCKGNQYVWQKLLTVHVRRSSKKKTFYQVPNRSVDTELEDFVDEEGKDLVLKQQEKQ